MWNRESIQSVNPAVANIVIPAKAGIHVRSSNMGPRFRGDDMPRDSRSDPVTSTAALPVLRDVFRARDPLHRAHERDELTAIATLICTASGFGERECLVQRRLPLVRRVAQHHPRDAAGD